MNLLALGLAVTLTVGAAPEDNYHDAYAKMERTGRPLLVLVGADWCPGCRSMKNATIPDLKRNGHLDSLVLAQVNTDREPELAKKLMRGGSIPQLILFTRQGDSWNRTQLTGAQDPNQLRAFLNRETAKHESKPGATSRVAN